jgi:uncharacterized membrane protein YhaH (DUF805 family)
MNTTLTRRLTAASMAAAAVLAIAGFTALGSIFDYPKILRSPAADILASYRQHDTAISAWFVVLVLSAVLIPLGLDIARLTNFAGYVTWCCLAGRDGDHAMAQQPRSQGVAGPRGEGVPAANMTPGFPRGLCRGRNPRPFGRI